MDNHYNPQDVQAGKAFNEQPEAGYLPDITQDETLAAIARIDSLIEKTKELIND